MSDNPTTIERAFEIARSGNVISIEELIAALHAEKYSNAREQIKGPLLRKQLLELMRASSRK